MEALGVLEPATRPQLRGVALAVMSDERLAALAGDGDEHAFALLYERYRRVLFRYCRSILRDAGDADDAFQNTMVAALRALRREPLTGQVKPWLYRIAHNESISLIRRRPAEQLLGELPDTRTEGLDPASRERLEQLLIDLQSLPENQRGALVLRELVGLEYEEIARVFSISSVAARKAVHEARLSLGALDEGRQVGCADIVRSIAGGDRRTLRSRRIRAHLRECSECTRFERGIRSRRAAFALIPVLPAAPVAGLLGAFGSALGFGSGPASAGGGAAAGGSAASAVSGAAAAGGTAAAGAAAPGFGAGVLMKCLGALAAVAMTGGGLMVGGRALLSGPSHRPSAQAVRLAGPRVAAPAAAVPSRPARRATPVKRELSTATSRMRGPAGPRRAVGTELAGAAGSAGLPVMPTGGSNHAGQAAPSGVAVSAPAKSGGLASAAQQTLAVTHTTLQRVSDVGHATVDAVDSTLATAARTVKAGTAGTTAAVTGTVQAASRLVSTLRLP